MITVGPVVWQIGDDGVTLFSRGDSSMHFVMCDFGEWLHTLVPSPVHIKHHGEWSQICVLIPYIHHGFCGLFVQGEGIFGLSTYMGLSQISATPKSTGGSYFVLLTWLELLENPCQISIFLVAVLFHWVSTRVVPHVSPIFSYMRSP